MISLGAGSNYNPLESSAIRAGSRFMRQRRAMASLGDGGIGATTDLSQYFSQFGIQTPDTFVPPGSPCYSAAVWKTMLGSDGKCYVVCTLDPSKSIEIDSESCKSGPMIIDDPISGPQLPSWAIPAGIGALLLILIMQ